MRIKLPIMFRSTHERVVFELEKDINVKELVIEAQDKKVKKIKDKKYELEIKNQTLNSKNENKNDIIVKLEEDLKEAKKQIMGMEWCIQERDKEIENVKAFNMKLYKKVELSGEMYRQFKDRIDKALEIDFVTGVITSDHIKKFKPKDMVELYTLIGIAGK